MSEITIRKNYPRMTENQIAFTRASKEYKNKTYHQIMAIQSFNGINAGSKGGFVESLDQIGFNSWLDENILLADTAILDSNVIVKNNKTQKQLSIIENEFINESKTLIDDVRIKPSYNQNKTYTSKPKIDAKHEKDNDVKPYEMPIYTKEELDRKKETKIQPKHHFLTNKVKQFTSQRLYDIVFKIETFLMIFGLFWFVFILFTMIRNALIMKVGF